MIIKSILDTDLYKLTQQNAILKYKKGIPVKYSFINRNPTGRFNSKFKKRFHDELLNFKILRLKFNERNFLKDNCPYLDDEYLDYLTNYQFKPFDEINFNVEDGQLKLEINGPWERVILWEVPLMALISELYFICCNNDWELDSEIQMQQIKKKSEILSSCKYVDFGTRRRRSQRVHFNIVGFLKNQNGFLGTSNVSLAQKLNLTPIGTLAHEFIMGISALEGLEYANRNAMRIWSETYQGRLGIFLTDTFGSDAFFKDFNGIYARLYDGVRQDSGDPNLFAEKAINHYNKLGINPLEKTIVFSDNLNAEKASELNEKWGNKIKVFFGIGTNFTNDFHNSPALNMVIKLKECNGIPVVKLSDDVSKATGDRDAIKVAKWTFYKGRLNE